MRECAVCNKHIYDDFIKTKKLVFEDEALSFCEHCIAILEQFESYGINSSMFKYIEWENDPSSFETNHK
jgi:hypothetical protein